MVVDDLTRVKNGSCLTVPAALSMLRFSPGSSMHDDLDVHEPAL